MIYLIFVIFFAFTISGYCQVIDRKLPIVLNNSLIFNDQVSDCNARIRNILFEVSNNIPRALFLYCAHYNCLISTGGIAFGLQGF
jgi:hypothetical protein